MLHTVQLSPYQFFTALLISAVQRLSFVEEDRMSFSIHYDPVDIPGEDVPRLLLLESQEWLQGP